MIVFYDDNLAPPPADICDTRNQSELYNFNPSSGLLSSNSGVLVLKLSSQPVQHLVLCSGHSSSLTMIKRIISMISPAQCHHDALVFSGKGCMFDVIQESVELCFTHYCHYLQYIYHLSNILLSLIENKRNVQF